MNTLTPPNAQDGFFCKVCGERAVTRAALRQHKRSYMHAINLTRAEMAARGWEPVRTSRPTLRAARIPHAYRRTGTGHPTNAPNWGPDHPSNFKNFVPAAVARTIHDWHSWDEKAKKKTTLRDYLKAMFGAVYSDAELNEVPVEVSNPAAAPPTTEDEE